MLIKRCFSFCGFTVCGTDCVFVQGIACPVLVSKSFMLGNFVDVCWLWVPALQLKILRKGVHWNALPVEYPLLFIFYNCVWPNVSSRIEKYGRTPMGYLFFLFFQNFCIWALRKLLASSFSFSSLELHLVILQSQPP